MIVTIRLWRIRFPILSDEDQSFLWQESCLHFHFGVFSANHCIDRGRLEGEALPESCWSQIKASIQPFLTSRTQIIYPFCVSWTPSQYHVGCRLELSHHNTDYLPFCPGLYLVFDFFYSFKNSEKFNFCNLQYCWYSTSFVTRRM